MGDSPVSIGNDARQVEANVRNVTTFVDRCINTNMVLTLQILIIKIEYGVD